MALKDIDKAAESKGSFLVTVWQFVKFIVVSLLAMLVQIALTNLIPLIPAIQEMYATEFNLWVLSYPVNYDEAGAIISGGLGYCIAFNVANIVAQIVAFFVNKEKHSTQVQMLQLHFQFILRSQLVLCSSQHGFHQHLTHSSLVLDGQKHLLVTQQ